MISQETLWKKYMESISKKVNLGAGEALQVINPTKAWNWGGQNPAPNAFSFEEFMFLNVVPSNPLQNTSDGSASSETGFDTSYQNWFNHLAIDDLSHDQPYNDLVNALNISLAKYTTDYQNAMATWKNVTSGQTPDFNTWLNDPAQMGVKMIIDSDAEDLTAKKSQLTDYRKQIQSSVNTISEAYNNSNYQGNISDPNSGKIYPVRLWTTDPVNPFSYVMDITGNLFGRDATKGTSGTISFNASTEEYNYNQYYGEASTGWNDFININLEGSYEKIQWSDFSSNFSIDISYQDIKEITISPESWYSGTNLAQYKNGPYSTGFSKYKSGNNNYFFGPGGSLSRIYKKMIVAYRPSVTITAGDNFASYLDKKWEINASFSIGPFYFSTSHTSEYKKSTVEVSNGKITFKSNDDWPQIIGMVSGWTVEPE